MRSIFSRLYRHRCAASVLSRLDRADLHATLRAEGTRYDAELADVIAAEAPPKWADLFGIDPGFVGGDLAAMAAPLGMDWGVDWRYVAPLPGMVTHTAGTYIFTDVTLTPLAAGMARDDLGTYAEPVAWTVQDVRAAMAAYDLGLGPVRRSDPPLYVACLADAVTP